MKKENTKTFDEIEARIRKIISDRVAEKEALQATIKNLDEQIPAARDKMVQASAKSDLKAYKSAKEELSDSVAMKEMAETKLGLMARESAPSCEEAKQLLQEALKDFRKENAMLRKECVKAGETLFSSAYENRRMFDRIKVLNDMVNHELNAKTGDLSYSFDEAGNISWAESMVRTANYTNETGHTYQELLEKIMR